ncbi:hypothetical protein [Pseudoalteromonas sp. D48-MNA-CIBAN-0056]|uniref:hypothetical protein n=1 Tax=Pseudoalteromonas sp. D48-MNA-CIBAN-0056 TaxID=3140417 RepID=UPI00331B5817
MSVCGNSADGLVGANEAAYISFQIEEVEGLVSLIYGVGEYESVGSDAINYMLEAAMGRIDCILREVNDALLGLAKERIKVRSWLSQASAILAALRCLNNNGESIAEGSPSCALSLAGGLLGDCHKAVNDLPLRDNGWQDNLLKMEVH